MKCRRSGPISNCYQRLRQFLKIHFQNRLRQFWHEVQLLRWPSHKKLTHYDPPSPTTREATTTAITMTRIYICHPWSSNRSTCNCTLPARRVSPGPSRTSPGTRTPWAPLATRNRAASNSCHSTAVEVAAAAVLGLDLRWPRQISTTSPLTAAPLPQRPPLLRPPQPQLLITWVLTAAPRTARSTMIKINEGHKRWLSDLRMKIRWSKFRWRNGYARL